VSTGASARTTVDVPSPKRARNGHIRLASQNVPILAWPIHGAHPSPPTEDRLVKMRHPAILHPLGIQTNPEGTFWISEGPTGLRTLSAALKRRNRRQPNPLRPEQTLGLLQAACPPVRHLHAQGMGHGHLDLGSWFVDERRALRLNLLGATLAAPTNEDMDTLVETFAGLLAPHEATGLKDALSQKRRRLEDAGLSPWDALEAAVDDLYFVTYQQTPTAFAEQWAQWSDEPPDDKTVATPSPFAEASEGLLIEPQDYTTVEDTPGALVTTTWCDIDAELLVSEQSVGPSIMLGTLGPQPATFDPTPIDDEASSLLRPRLEVSWVTASAIAPSPISLRTLAGRRPNAQRTRPAPAPAPKSNLLAIAGWWFVLGFAMTSGAVIILQAIGALSR
jgi:hypothetical protein